MAEGELDAIDRRLIDRLHGGFPIEERPFRTVALELGLEEEDVIARLGTMREEGYLTRFGPLFDAAALGGAFALCAMEVPAERFEEVAGIVNGFAEVAHNYQRAHRLNMWFVVATEKPEATSDVVTRIEQLTAINVLSLPKLQEYFLELKLSA